MSSQETDVVTISLKTEFPVAYDSPDHLNPLGTAQDNSVNRRFNQKLYRLFAARPHTTLKVLDLGCSGGGFVRSLIDDGCLAVGLEGSDFSLRRKRAEWRSIPNHLFTCDITKPFSVLMDEADGPFPGRFDVITSWEVLEHVVESDLPAVCENVRKHLLPHGLWICSVTPTEQVIHGASLHQNTHAKAWWLNQFSELGFNNNPSYVDFFNTQFVRGPKNVEPATFVLVLSLKPEPLGPPARERLRVRAYDRWLGSRPQRFLAGTLT